MSIQPDDANAFEEFPKISRFYRECVITEKLDGINAQILFPDDDGLMRVGTRTKWIDVTDDAYGFARWAHVHEGELRKGLGYGRHFGEWWGAGLGRRYDLTEKRFSLFNTVRWSKPDVVLPACVSLVPVLYQGTFSDQAVADCLTRLQTHGSVAAPGFMRPEGVIVFHVAAQVPFKVTLDGDGHKGS